MLIKVHVPSILHSFNLTVLHLSAILILSNEGSALYEGWTKGKV